MKRIKIIMSAVLLLGYLFPSLLLGLIPTEIQISSPDTTIHMGEPLVLKLMYRFKEPIKDTKTGEIHSQIHHESFPFFQLMDNDRIWLSKYPEFNDYTRKEGDAIYHYYPLDALRPSVLTIQDGNGLEYGTYCLLSYNRYKTGLIFDELCTYKIFVKDDTLTISSNTLSIDVTTRSTEGTQCFLSDPNDYVFLLGIKRSMFDDPNNRSKAISHLKVLAERCEDTLLAKWAAARLGLEYFKEFDDKHGNFKNFKAKYQAKEIEEPMIDQAITYMNIGLQLPDDFSLRQELLYNLSMLEYIKDNYDRSFSLLEELKNKYPMSEYGKKTESTKRELLEIQRSEKEQEKLKDES